MKIAIIASYAPSIKNFRESLILALLKNHTVIILAPYEDKKTQEDILALGALYYPIFIHSTGINPLKDLISLIKLTFLLKKQKPDIVLSYTIKPVIWGSFAARLAGIKNINAMITGLGYAFTDATTISRKTIQKIVSLLYKISLSFNRSVFFQNKDDQTFFYHLNILSRKTKSIIINGSGVDISHYAFSKIPTKKPIKFLLIARLLKDKGLLEYIEAAKILLKKYHDIEFHIAGYIDKNPAAISNNILKEWIDLNIITFHGRVEDVRPIIRSINVYVLPSYREGTPRSVLEAMSMGRPVITTDAPGCRETVIDGYNGYLVPIKDIEALVEAMEKFIQQPDLIEKMGINARKLVEEKYEVSTINKVILDNIF